MADSACGISRSNYIPASFNGIPFDCIEATSEHGRRGAEGEFPFGETTAYADLGRRIRTYTLNAEFRGNDHIQMAAALIAACELPGPGVLVHPTRGIVSAACKSIRVSDNLEESRGVTSIDLEFVEGNAWPNGLSLVGTLLGLAIGPVIGASRTSFKTRYHPKQVTPARRPVVIDTAQESIKLVADDYAQVIHTQDNDKKWRSLNELREVQNEDILAADTETMDEALALGMNALAREISGEVKYNTFKDYANWAASPVTLPGFAGEVEDSIYTHVRIISAAYMAQGSVEADYARIDAALTHLDAIVAILDDEISNARFRCDNALHLALEDFKTQVQTILYEKSYHLPKLVQYNFHGGVHTLVAAYAIHNDAKRHRELELRNIVDMTGRIGPHVIAATA